jgi:hypothetical protein
LLSTCNDHQARRFFHILIIEVEIFAGILNLFDDKVEWKDKTNTVVVGSYKDEILTGYWSLIGPRAHLKINLKNYKALYFDGFEKSDYEKVASFFSNFYKVDVILEEVRPKPYSYVVIILPIFSKSFLNCFEKLRLYFAISPRDHKRC